MNPDLSLSRRMLSSSCCHVLAHCDLRLFEPAHAILELIAYAQMLLINAVAGVSSRARGIHIDLHLHLHSYFMNASSEKSGESAHMRRLT